MDDHDKQLQPTRQSGNTFYKTRTIISHLSDSAQVPHSVFCILIIENPHDAVDPEIHKSYRYHKSNHDRPVF